MNEQPVLVEIASLMSECRRRLRHGEGTSAITPAGVLAQGWAGCGGFSLVFASFAAEAGLAARLVGFRYGIGDADTHVLVEVLVDGAWMLCDPSANCFIPGTSFAAVLNDPQRTEFMVRQPLPPEHAWMYRYFTAAHLAAVSEVWVSNGPSGYARQQFGREEYLQLVAHIDAACERFPNCAVAIAGRGARHWLRTVYYLVKYRGKIAVAPMDPVLVMLGRLTRLVS